MHITPTHPRKTKLEEIQGSERLFLVVGLGLARDGEVGEGPAVCVDRILGLES